MATAGRTTLVWVAGTVIALAGVGLAGAYFWFATPVAAPTVATGAPGAGSPPVVAPPIESEPPELPPEQRELVCFRGNPERNLSGVGPVPRHPKLLWRFRTTTKLEGPYEHRGDKSLNAGSPWEGMGWTGQPCIQDGRVYFGSADSYVYCLDLKTGRGNWNYPNHHVIKGSISIQNGRIYHGGRDNKIHCYTLRGKMVWETRIGQDTDSNPVLVDGILYIGGEDNTMYAVNPDTGKIVWEYEDTRGSLESSPCVANGLVYIGSDYGDLYCFEAKTGKLKWKAPSGGDGDSTPVHHAGVIYAASKTKTDVETGRVFAVDAKTSKLLWERNLPRGVWATVAINPARKRLYVGCNNGVVYCLKSGTGETVWTRDLHGRIWSSPVVSGGCVLVGVRNGTLWCLEEEGGKPVWVFDSGADIDATPALADGTIVIGNQYGWVFGIGEDESAPAKPNPHWFRTGPDFSRATDHGGTGIPTYKTHAETPKAYQDTDAACRDHYREPVYGPAYDGPKPGASPAKASKAG
jgi:outer membrane protein assembly factor BamB